LSRGERGASLLLVIVALAALMPVALVLSDLVLMRQRQVMGFQQNLGGQAAARGALDMAMSRLRAHQVALEWGQSTEFTLETTPRPVRVRVVRQPDVVIALDGTVLDHDEAEDLDTQAFGIDTGTGGLVHRYRRLEVYLVEAECAARYPVAAVRLLAVVGRVEDRVINLGLRYDRGYFP
jgi:hypothetical protein